MIGPKKLITVARKWQKVAASWGKRIYVPRINQGLNAHCCSTSSVADKGLFVVYTADQVRFMVPLAYLNTDLQRPPPNVRKGVWTALSWTYHIAL